MSRYTNDEIIKMFQAGTWTCANNCIHISIYMKRTYGWNEIEYDKYESIYIDSFL